MNKVLIVILILGAGALAYYLLAGKTDLFLSNENINEELVEEALKETDKRTVYGSCNDILTQVTALTMLALCGQILILAELNCGEGRTYSTNACPYSEFGGCQMNGESVMESIACI